MPCLLGVSTPYNKNGSYFFLSRAKRAEEEQQVKKVKMFSITKTKFLQTFSQVL